MSIDADGTQWTNAALGRNLDESVLAAEFFGPPPAPKPAPPKPAPVPVPVPAWQETMMNNLPVLSEGTADKQGEVFFVHRAQALVKVYGEITDLPDAARQEVTGVFDGATAAAVRAVQAHHSLTADGIVGPQTWGLLVTGKP